MNECTIESFINFCDDMMIANEGFNKNDILHAIDVLIEKIENFILKIQSKIRQYKTKNINGFSLEKKTFAALKEYRKVLDAYYYELVKVVHNSGNVSALLKLKNDVAESFQHFKKVGDASRDMEPTVATHVNINFGDTNFGLDRLKQGTKLLADAKNYCRRKEDFDETIIEYVRDYTSRNYIFYSILYNAGQIVKKQINTN